MRTTMIVTALLLAAGAVATARSIDVRMTSIGAQIASGAVVAAGTFEDSGTAPTERGIALRFRIDRVIAGAPRADAIVRFAPGAPRPEPGRRVLAFLSEDGREGEFRLGLDLMSVVPLPDAGRPSDALQLVAAQAEFLLDEAPDAADRMAYRRRLARAAVIEDGWLARSALLDLLARPALVPALDADERASLRLRFGTLPPHDDRRRWIVEVLGRAGDAGAAILLVNALAGADGRVLRPALGRALGRIDDDNAARRLLELRKDGAARVRADVADALGRWARPEFRGPLEDRLEDADAGVRETAAIALGRMGTSGSFPALRDALEAATAFPVRRALVWALGRLDTPESLTLVGVVARDDEDDRLRAWALQVRKRPRAAYTLR